MQTDMSFIGKWFHQFSFHSNQSMREIFCFAIETDDPTELFLSLWQMDGFVEGQVTIVRKA